MKKKLTLLGLALILGLTLLPIEASAESASTVVSLNEYTNQYENYALGYSLHVYQDMKIDESAMDIRTRFVNADTTIDVYYDDFTNVLNRMNNDDFALFLTGYAESIGRNIQLLPIHIDKFDCLAWVGYFTENGGLNGDDENRFIVSEILKNAYCSDYVLIEEEEERPKLTFFTKKNLKNEMFKHLFVVKLFTDKKAWSEPLYENGRSNDPRRKRWSGVWF